MINYIITTGFMIHHYDDDSHAHAQNRFTLRMEYSHMQDIIINYIATAIVLSRRDTIQGSTELCCAHRRVSHGYDDFPFEERLQQFYNLGEL
jgi:hypothetical protein